MRYQDRILRIWPPKSPSLAQYLAREMEGLVLYPDFGAVIGALEQALQEQPNPAAAQASLALRRLQPGYLRNLYSPPSAPVQSRLLQDAKLDEPATEDPSELMARQATRDALRRSATMLLEPLVDPLAAIVKSSDGPRRRRAMHALGQLMHRRAGALLRELAATPGFADAPLAALLAAGYAHKEAETLEAVRAHDGAALLALGAAPSAPALQFLSERIAPGANDLLPQAAAALEGFEPSEAEPLLARIAALGHGWGMVHALETLGRHKPAGALELAARLYTRYEQPAVRGAAIKLAAAVGGEAGRAFLVHALSKRPDPTVAARALEGLTRFAGVSDSYAPVFAEHALSPHPECAAAALLGLARADRARAAAVLKSWVVSTDPAWRCEAAYTLGYIQGKFSVSLLGKLGLDDPDETVRLQAARSLALHERSPQAAGALLTLLAGRDSAVRVQAALLLGHPELAEDREVVGGLGRALQVTTDDAEAAAIARAIGRLGSALAREMLIGETRAVSSPERLRGVYDGLDLLPPSVAGNPWRNLPPGQPAVVAAAAARGLWHAGEVSAVGLLADLLKPEQDAVDAAIDEVARIGVTSLELISQDRFSALRDRLRKAMHEREYREFAAEEFSVHLAPGRLPAGFDPLGESDLARRWDEAEGRELASDDVQQKVASAMRRSRRRVSRSLPDPGALDGTVSPLSGSRGFSLAFALVAVLVLISGVQRSLARTGARTVEQAQTATGTVVPAALQVLNLSAGATHVPAGGGPLRVFPGSAVRPGATLQAGPDKAVLLAGPGGEDRLRLLPGSSLKVQAVTWNRASRIASIELASLEGSLFVELANPRTECRVTAGGGVVTARKGVVLLRASGPTVTVQVARGRAELGPAVLTEGQQADLTGGKAGPIGPCEADFSSPALRPTR